MWNDSTITSAGTNLLAQWAEGSVLNICGATGGTGTVDPSALKDLTALTNEKQTGSIVNIERNDQSVLVKVQFPAAGSAYMLNQIGLWAQIDGGTPVLLAVYQDETGTSIPSTGQFLYNFIGAVAITNAGNITVTIDTLAFVTLSTLQAALNSYVAKDTRGQRNGVASLDSAGKVPVAQIPDLSDSYISRSKLGAANGAASLDENGKVPSSQLPSMNFIPSTDRGKAGGVASLDQSSKIPVAQIPDLSSSYIPANKKGVANGVASLDNSGKVPASQLPSMNYVPTSAKGTAGGVATLDNNAKIPAAQIPSLSYIPTSQKAVPNGVATLAEDGKVNPSQLRGGFIVSDTEPEDTTLLWITPAGVMKFYFNEEWHIVVPTWG